MAEYIEREALKELFRRHFKMAIDANLHIMDTVAASCAVISLINGAEKAEVEPVRHGRWIDKQEDDMTEGMWRCSVCGEDFYFLEDNPSEYGAEYCSACGARMDGGAENV